VTGCPAITAHGYTSLSWWAAPNRQGLIMLRLRLGSPAEGEIEVGALEADGHDYP
jgi:hypothetical protein